MADDYLKRIQQAQFSTGFGTDNLTGMQGTGFGTSLQNSDIWTQAQMLENKYKSQIQIAASINPLETSKVMNEFMGEALDMLFSSLSTPSSVSGHGVRETDNAEETNEPEDTQQADQTSEVKDTDDIQEAGKTTEEQKTDTAKKSDKSSKTKLSSEYSQKYIDEIDKYFEDVSKGVSGNSATTFIKAWEDPKVSTGDKIKILKHYREAAKEHGYKDSTTWKEEAIVKELHDKIKTDSSASEVLDSIIDLNNLLGTDKKGNQRYSAALYKNSAQFAIDLYLKAQKEGMLEDALEVIPPTETIQKTLRLGKETKAIQELIQGLNDNAGRKNAETKADKFGLDEQRAKQLDREFDLMAQGYNGTFSDGVGLEYDFLPKLFEAGRYTEDEQLYLLNTAFEKSKTNKNKKGEISDFVKVFRAMSSKGEEEYLPKILNLYAKFQKS